MTYERAVEIVEACTANGIYHMTGQDPPPLDGFSLSEMVEAQRVVRDTERGREGVGPRTLHVVCDDRLVAALYVAANYRGDDPSDADPICMLPDGRAVVVLQTKPAEVIREVVR